MRKTFSVTVLVAMCLIRKVGHAAQSPMAEGSAKKFVHQKTHDSKRGYLKALRRPFVDIEAGDLGFFDSQGRLVKKISLKKESSGYSHHPIVTEDRAVIVKSTGGYEWAAFSFEFYSPSGNKTAVVPGSTGAAAVSPKGKVMIVAHPNGQYHFNGTFSLHALSGTKIADFSVPDISGTPGFAFSPEGHIGVILTDGYRAIPQSKNRILIFSETGELLGRYETKAWSVQAADLEGSGPLKFNRLARIDEVNRVVVGEGFDSATLKRITFAIDFAGTLLWRRNHRVDTNACPSTMIAKPASQRIVIADFCDQKIDLAELDIKTGQAIHEREIASDSGQPVFATGSTDGENILITLSKKSGNSMEKRSALLLDSTLRAVWKEVLSGANDEARFNPEGSAVIRRGSEIQVGRFE